MQHTVTLKPLASFSLGIFHRALSLLSYLLPVGYGCRVIIFIAYTNNAGWDKPAARHRSARPLQHVAQRVCWPRSHHPGGEARVSAVLRNGLTLDIAEPLAASSLLLLCLVMSGLCFSESLLNSRLCYQPLRTGISSAILLRSGFAFCFILQALVAYMLSHLQVVTATAHCVSLS